MTIHYRIHCLNTMKVYVDLNVSMESNETDEFKEENRETLNIIHSLFFKYSGCNIQASLTLGFRVCIILVNG